MKGSLFVILILTVLSEIFFCGVGVVKIFQLRAIKSRLLNAFGLTLFGVMLDRIAALIAMQYRPHLTEPLKTEYLSSIISGRVICAVCVGLAVAFLLGLKNGHRGGSA